MGNPPPYSQYQNNNQQQYNQQQNIQNLSQALSQNNMSQQFGKFLLIYICQIWFNINLIKGQNNMNNRMQNMGPPSLNIPQAGQLTLAQQISMSRMQRPSMQRSIIPRMSGNSIGMNQQQQQVCTKWFVQRLNLNPLRHT